MGSLPKEVFESAYIDGASAATAFFRLALPMSVPAIAALAIFQFLFIWNDLLVAFVYLGSVRPENLPMTVQINNLVNSVRGGLGAPRAGGVHLDGAAARRVLLAPAVLRPRHHRRRRQGLIAFVRTTLLLQGAPAGRPGRLRVRR